MWCFVMTAVQMGCLGFSVGILGEEREEVKKKQKGWRGREGERGNKETSE